MSQVKPIILITGITGFVGHHIIQFIDKTYPLYNCYATYNSKSHTVKSNNITYIKLNLSNEDSIQTALDSIFNNNMIPQIIIHCAAITSVGFCEKNQKTAMEINCPTVFMDALLKYYKQQKIERDPLFIFFSTGHVYNGELLHSNTIKHAMMYDNNNNNKEDNKMDAIYSEKSPCYPMNNYGKSKLMMEKYLLMHWNNLVILRCSVIFAPENPQKSTLLQSVVQTLKKTKDGKNFILFKNEKRNFVSIWSVIKTVEYFINKYDTKYYHDIYNCGGSECLTRVEFAEICAQIYSLDSQKINAMNRLDCKESWAHKIPTPENISMSSDKLYRELKDCYTFPSLVDTIKQIKTQEMHKI